MTTELDTFVGDYIWRKSYNLPNFWITKPVTLTKSIDMSVTDNLDMIIRIGETGQKIVCKYLEDQLRYRGVKFDLRQYVLVRSVSFNQLSSNHLKFMFTRTLSSEVPQMTSLSTREESSRTRLTLSTTLRSRN